MNKYKNIYWIGGSPCSGKSTIAELLVKDFGFNYYKCDDHLDEYIERGTDKKIEVMKKFATMSLNDTWLRDVHSQVEDEFEFYREAFQFIKEDLSKLSLEKPLIVEGAAILPELVMKNGIDLQQYICLVPTKEFQLDKYSQRKWVEGYLSGCTNPKQAYSNWMNRDIQFALKVKEDAYRHGIRLIVIDGSSSIEENYEQVKAHYKL